ncbi:MAG: tetratricopeptide repeat protein [Candidatus Riflebacteria bacterium]|nr:tetratricopeptide repeat protein [Candidatus Riflebacteria bacterium]
MVKTESPPVGLVTLVFTDVQGSTGLWENAPDVMRSALATHDSVMRETIDTIGGYEVKTEGDAFMVAFGDPISAIKWCLTVQERLMAAEWPPQLFGLTDAAKVLDTHGRPIFCGLRVRMGIHSGIPECKPDPKTGRMDYFGPMVNRAARVGGAAHGGQILVSGSVWERVSSRLSGIGSPFFCDLGQHRLKGLESLEQLVMLIPMSLAERRFPPPKTLNPNLTNLFPNLSSFIGREEELVAIDRLIARNIRLITITGMGGMGKTRLVSHYGATRLEAFSEQGQGGIWFCDLSEATTLSEICEAVGRALQIPLSTGGSATDLINQLGTSLASRGRILLIFDNFEQVVQHASATVGQWLKIASSAIFLVTTRESLRLQGEVVTELLPLPLPESPSDFSKSAAVKLFLERAESIRSGSIVSEEDFFNVGKIVQQLDGIPLAIELAAARIGIFSPSELLDRLSQHLVILASGRRDNPDRQSTLRKTIDWSWVLLEPWEQSVAAQCSVFHGGFALEATEHILDVSLFPQAPPVFEIIQTLRQKSILRSFGSLEIPGRLRFGMYCTVQEYAREKFQDFPLKDAIHLRHSTYYLKLGRLLSPRLPGGGGDKRLRKLALEQENLRGIQRWVVSREPLTRESANLALETALVLDPLFTTRGPLQARLESLEVAMELANNVGADPSLLAWACEARGRAFLVAGFPDASEETYEKGLAYARESGDRKAQAFILRNIGLKKMFSGARMHEAREKFETALVLLKELGDRPCAASVLGDIGCCWLAQRELDRAVEFLEQARQENAEVGNLLHEGLALSNLGVIYQETAHFDKAETAFSQAAALGEELGDHRLQGFASGSLGCLLLEAGRLKEAENCLRTAINYFKELGDQTSLKLFLAALGSCLASSGSLDEAETIFASFDFSRLDSFTPHFAQTEKLHYGVYQVYRAEQFSRDGCLEKVNAHARLARSIFKDGKKAPLDSEDVRFALRLLSKAIKALPKLQSSQSSEE